MGGKGKGLGQFCDPVLVSHNINRLQEANHCFEQFLYNTILLINLMAQTVPTSSSWRIMAGIAR